MKKLLAVLLTAVLLLTLCSCGKKAAPPPVNAPASVQELATAYLRAYCLEDVATVHALSLHDARQLWEDSILREHKTEEAFCTLVQKQAEEQGLSVKVESFDDYLRERYRVQLLYTEENYGAYTVSAEIESSVPMSAEELATFRSGLKGGFYADYLTEEQVDNITEAHTVTMVFAIHGEKKDYSEHYTLYVALCNGQWKVADHSA